MSCTRKAVLFVFVSHLAKCAIGGRSPLWDYCGCRWENWESWSDCSAECNGSRYRSRKVWLYTDKDGCPFKFTTCATNDMGSDYSRCNAFCYNGGTSNSYSCSCVIGFYGKCCKQQINCGHPGEIANGKLSGTTFTYGSSLTYSCNKNYILVDGSTRRVCQITHTWSGTKPRCAYYSSCDSSPCKNNASCTNIPDDYTCHCRSGWSGKICDNDIQPPLKYNCPSNKVMQVTDLKQYVEWNKPSFSDPHNFDVHVTSNYPQNNWIFPWGDHNISYFAIKPSNGLSTECLFSIIIRPKPCPELTVPLNAALVCNDWKTDFGKICTYFCDKVYTVPRGMKPNQLYVCGATGLWTPNSLIPNCSVMINKLQSELEYEIGESYTTCTGDQEVMKTFYINQLKASPFKYLCTKYKTECNEKNVKIKC